MLWLRNAQSIFIAKPGSNEVIACLTAASQAISPHVIAKGKTLRTLHGVDTESSPCGTTWSVSEKGWTKQGIAKLWIEQTSLQNIGAARLHLMILMDMIPIFCGIN